jgi:hypothetical protein
MIGRPPPTAVKPHRIYGLTKEQLEELAKSGRLLPSRPAIRELPGPESIWPERGEDLGDAIEQFVVDGGQVFFDDDGLGNLIGLVDGAQIVSVVYVPTGYTGFIKDLMVCPLVNDHFLETIEQGAGGPNFVATLADAMWRAPRTWERFIGADGTRPSWTWELLILAGSPERKLRNTSSPPIPQFPGTWQNFLIPNRTCDIGPYQQSQIGPAPGRTFTPQRTSRFAGGGGVPSQHVIIPEDTTAILLTKWHNPALDPQDPDLFTLGPSIGQLWGYMQRNTRKSGHSNVTGGAGG